MWKLDKMAKMSLPKEIARIEKDSNSYLEGISCHRRPVCIFSIIQKSVYI